MTRHTSWYRSTPPPPAALMAEMTAAGAANDQVRLDLARKRYRDWYEDQTHHAEPLDLDVHQPA